MMRRQSLQGGAFPGRAWERERNVAFCATIRHTQETMLAPPAGFRGLVSEDI